MASNLFDGPTPPKLKAITINGAIQVESEEDRIKREERRKQRKSRWDQSQNSKKKASTSSSNSPFETGPILALPAPGGIKDNPAALAFQRSALPTIIDASKMDDKQQQIYLLQMQIHEATRNLARPDLGIPANPRDRSPSPEPIYNNKGIRINTRIDRTRNKLINQRNNAITKLKEVDPTYQPPSQYKYKNAQLEDRVLIPADVSSSLRLTTLH